MTATRPASPYFLEREEDMRTPSGSDDEERPRQSSSGEHDELYITLVRAAYQLMLDLMTIEASQDHATLTTVIIMRAAITATELAFNASRAAKR